MTRREIIRQILSEASMRPIDEVDDLFESLTADGILSGRELDVDFPEVEGRQMLEEFRSEIVRIREVLIARDLLW